jgi:hypothetical protein
MWQAGLAHGGDHQAGKTWHIVVTIHVMGPNITPKQQAVGCNLSPRSQASHLA